MYLNWTYSEGKKEPWPPVLSVYIVYIVYIV